MAQRLEITKTYKLYIGGKFPRTESGRSIPLHDAKDRVIAHVCNASRKDLRESVEAARSSTGWASMTAYNRGQVMYRLAEMLEGKSGEFQQSLQVISGLTAAQARRQVEESIDRLICFAGWTDKFAQVTGSHNPVAGPYYNFTVAEPTGVVAVICPDEPALLGMISLLAAPLCAGNTIVLVASETNPVPAVLLAEACATSDVPGGTINILTGRRSEVLEHIAEHREINAIGGAGLNSRQRKILQEGVAENLKRVHLVEETNPDFSDTDAWTCPWNIEQFTEMKTIWHPSST
ncbi:MAG: aldehyde dehydrogenase [Phycisphaerae bacterium]|nr:aldehyde dehydrogenase [Phycisphaerae bacterium]